MVRELRGIAIDYKNADFVREIHRLTGDGVDAVFDGIGGNSLWRSRDALRQGGLVVTYASSRKCAEGGWLRLPKGATPFARPQN